MSTKTVFLFKNLSSAAYLAPAGVAFFYGLYPTAILSVAVAGFGILYHLSNEKKFLLLDFSFALLLILSNFILIYLGNFKAPYIWFVALFVVLSFWHYFFRQKHGSYEWHHGMWHVYGALITIFCIFTHTF